MSNEDYRLPENKTMCKYAPFLMCDKGTNGELWKKTPNGFNHAVYASGIFLLSTLVLTGFSVKLPLIVALGVGSHFIIQEFIQNYKMNRSYWWKPWKWDFHHSHQDWIFPVVALFALASTYSWIIL